MIEAQLFEALQSAIEAVTGRVVAYIHTQLPGIVQSFSEGRIEAVPAVSVTGDNGEEITLPVIVDIPVIYPRTSKFSLTFPLEKGDGVLLIFCEYSTDGYNETGKKSLQSDPRQHSLTDAVALAGYFGGGKGQNPGSWDKTEIVFGKSKIILSDDGTIDFNNGALKVTA